MSRAQSIHIGVNRPGHRCGDRPLQYSEATAWRMAELACQAGYDSLQVLRGAEATRHGVHAALTGAAGVLTAGDTLLVTFSGHGVQVPDQDCDERDGFDESWCLTDEVLLDDTLAGYWSLFEEGVRIVVVAESCHAAGSGRDADDPYAGRTPCSAAERPQRWRGEGAEVEAVEPCIVQPRRHHDGIRASVLMLCASGENHAARDGIFSRYLLNVWDDGAFRGSYCRMYREVSRRVMADQPAQIPQIVMLGATDPEFSIATAFHLDRVYGTGGRPRGGAMRGG